MLAFACFGGAFYSFVASFFWTDYEQGGVQAIAVIIAVIGIPFYFLARFGWRLSHKKPGQAATGEQLNHERDLSDKIVQIIETTEDIALFFTYNKLIVARVEGLSNSGYYGNDALSIFTAVFGLIQSQGAASKLKQLSKVSPQEVLDAHYMNFAIPYSQVSKVEFFRKWLRRKIRVTAGRTLEYRLRNPRKVKSYVNALRNVLPDKLVVS